MDYPFLGQISVLSETQFSNIQGPIMGPDMLQFSHDLHF